MNVLKRSNYKYIENLVIEKHISVWQSFGYLKNLNTFKYVSKKHYYKKCKNNAFINRSQVEY